MKETYPTINYDRLTSHTGDVFADTGGHVIKYLLERYPEKDIMQLIEYITNIYVNKWDAKINTFFLNSKITQPAYNKKQKADETLKYFSELITNKAQSTEGHCRISGEKTSLYKAGRDNSIMSGSGTFINFHHNFQSGIMLSREMIIRMFFVPFGVISVGGKIAIIQSNNDYINHHFIKEICKKNTRNIGSATSGEVLKSEYGIPANALFSFINDLLFCDLPEIHSRITQELSFTLYHFTNFGASPEISLYQLPANVFCFYSTCHTPELKKDWMKFERAHYKSSKYKEAKYDTDKSIYEFVRKNEKEMIPFDDYKLWRNMVLESLLNNKPLLPLFLKWGKNNLFNFKIVEIYQKYIRNMRQETINKIKELAKFLVKEDEDTIQKHLKRLNGCKNSYEVRRFLLKEVTVRNYNDGAKEPILTLEDMVYYLFPDDQPWKDIRDLLLFAVYQELHALNKKITADLLQEEENDDLENE